MAVQGMPAKSILREAASFDTIGNAFFALTMHAIPAGWRCAPGWPRF